MFKYFPFKYFDDNMNYYVCFDEHGKLCYALDPKIYNFIIARINNFKSKLELSALSKRKLIQKEWITKPSNEVLKGWKEVKTIDYEKLNEKYKINSMF